MNMPDDEIKEILLNQTIELPENGIERWPGEFMRLDTEEIQFEGEIIEISIFVWYELTKEKTQPEKWSGFIISLGNRKYAYTDFFFQAIGVWNYLLNTYRID